MLRYKIPSSGLQAPTEPLKIVDSSLMQYWDATDGDGGLLVCTYDDEAQPFAYGETAYAATSVSYQADEYGMSPLSYTITSILKVFDVDHSKRRVVFKADYKLQLHPSLCTKSDVNLEDAEGGTNGKRTYIYLYFSPTHGIAPATMLYEGDEADMTGVSDDSSDGDESETRPPGFVAAPIVVSVRYASTDEDNWSEEQVEWERVNNSSLRFDCSEHPDAPWVRALFPSDDGRIVGDLDVVSFSIPNYLLNGDYPFVIHKGKKLPPIEIPISQSFETNLMQADALRHQYVENRRKAFCPDIEDSEMEIVYPAICKSKEGSYQLTPATEIVFNFHFRQREGDDWKISNYEDCWWNGCYKDGKKWAVSGSVAKEGFSDLLSYLNFNNRDVKYQKNRLKKTHIRLSYYDNDIAGSKSLLQYARVYINTKSLFAKYCKFSGSDYTYTVYTYDNDDKAYSESNTTGIKVSGEPVFEETSIDISDDEWESRRLSSQIRVSSRDASTSSSEGFYLYLPKSILNSQDSVNLYTAIDFNHAGYGRSLPMMLPYFGAHKTEANESGPKNLEAILEDFCGNKNGMYIKYGPQLLNKYLHIKFKCEYSLADNRYYYFLDPDYYGYSDSFDTVMRLELFEGKIWQDSSSNS